MPTAITETSTDTELLAICAQLQTVDAAYIRFDETRSGDPDEICRIGNLRDELVARLADIRPVTPEGVRAQALATLPLLRHYEDEQVREPLNQLIQRIVATAAGLPALGDSVDRFRLAVRVLKGGSAP